jgi:hypothetical protein
MPPKAPFASCGRRDRNSPDDAILPVFCPTSQSNFGKFAAH